MEEIGVHSVVIQTGEKESYGLEAQSPDDPELLASKTRQVVGVGDPNDNVEDRDFLDDDAPDVPPEQALELPAPEPDVPARSAKPRRHPGDPAKAEMDAHNLTHANYRSRCAICSKAAFKDDPYYRQIKEG